MNVFSKDDLVSSFVIAASLNIAHQQLIQELNNRAGLTKICIDEKNILYKINTQALERVMNFDLALRDNLCVQ